MSKANTISGVDIPPRLARRPRDSRGLPIPRTVLIDATGKPDFRVTDSEKWVWLVKNRCCALCGEPLGRHLAFIGGPLSHENRYFTDLPMHKDCAEFAVRVCPFLASPHFKYAEGIKEKDGVVIHVADHVTPTRPEKFFVGIALSYTVVQAKDGSLMVHSSPWTATTWWKHGQQLEA